MLSRYIKCCWLLGLSLIAGAPSLRAAPEVSLGTGNQHTLVVRPDGTLWGLGGNDFAQLGDGTQTARTTPFQISSEVKAASAGSFHSLFIKEDGTLWGMGRNLEGQLGTGTAGSNQTQPVQIAQDVVAVSAGHYHSLFIKTDGTLWAMGQNGDGQLGDGTDQDRAAPVQVASNVSAVAAGLYHSAFVKTDGSLWTMGWNDYGQLGDGSSLTERHVPVQIATQVSRVVAGYAHTVFLKTNSTVWTTGYNNYGQLGDGTLNSRTQPVQVATGVSGIGCGSIHTVILKSDGSLWTVGWNSSGQLGTGDFETRLSFVQIATGVLEIGTGPYNWHTLFSKTDYSVLGVGSNGRGQLGPTIGYFTQPELLFASPFGAPEITLQPAATTALGGEAAAFSVSADGDPAPTFQWQRLPAGATAWANLANDDTFSGVTTTTLSIDPAMPDMTGDSFRCVASNLVGTAVSASATLTVIHPLPAPVISPAGGVVPTGQSVTLSIAAEGAELRYTTDGSEPTEASPLYTAPFAVDPPVTLKVRAFKAGQPPSPITAAGFERLLPPQIVFQSESSTFRRGSTVTLTTIATGGNLSYQWFEGAKGDTTNPIVGADSSVLVRSELLASVNYWVRVSNAAGQADSETIALTLNSLPLDNWIDVSLPVTGIIRALAVGGSGVPAQIVAAGQPRVIYAINASLVKSPENWLLRHSYDVNYTLSSVIWTGTQFVAMGVNGDWYTSINGGTWTFRSSSNGPYMSTSVATNGTAFIAVAGGDIYRSTNITNTNGWTFQSLTDGSGFYSIIWTGSQFVAVGSNSSNGSAIYTSPNGTTWTRQAQGLSTATLRSVIYAGEQYVAVGANGTVATSPDAITWTLRNSGVTAELKSVAWSGRTYLAVGAGGTILSSPNGIDWTARYSGITSGLETVIWEPNYQNFVTAGYSGRVLVTSDDPPGPPAIIAQPQPRTIGLNQTATLQVTASGSGLAYQWYQGVSGDTRTPLAGKTTRTLVTAALTADSQFWVRISNAGGAIDSNAATVTVVQPPEISVHPSSRAVTVGEAVQLNGAATGVGSLTYQWQRKPAGSETWSNLAEVAPFSGIATNTLSVSAVSATLAGDSFRLVATNLGGSAFSDAATLTANQPPAFVRHPEDASGAAFAPMSFTVEVDALPAAIIRWQYRAAGSSEWVTLTDGTGITGSSGTTLTFNVPSAALDGSQVRSLALNDSGLAISNSAILDIARNAQTIAFEPLVERTLSEGSFSLSAFADSGLAVSYTSSDPLVATISGNVVTLVGIGSTTITARQPGNVDWLPANSVQQTLTVIAGVESQTFAAWAEELGLTGEDALPDAIPFADGLPNLVRYAMNLGLSPPPEHLPSVATILIGEVTHLAMEYRQRKGLAGVILIPEWSIDLVDWTPVSQEQIWPLDDDDDATARYRVVVPMGSDPHVFLRARAQSSP